MPSLDASAAFFGAALLLGFAPGPDIIFVLTQSALFGARAGICTTSGLISGLCFHTLAVALGVAALLAASPPAFIALKFSGAAYLCWLAWLSFRASANEASLQHSHFPGYGALFRRGMIMNITNPKVALFFLAFLPQFCTPEAGPMFWQIVWFGFLFMVAALCAFCPVAFMGGKLAHLFNKSPWAQIYLNRTAGLVFIALAIALAVSDGKI